MERDVCVEDFEKFLDKRLYKKKFKKLKDSELFEITEDVFSYYTLMALYDLINSGVIDKMYGVVATGKEARVYWAKAPDGRDLAVKIFKVETTEFRKTRLKYMIGDRRFSRIRRDLRSIIRAWCSKEYRNLRRAHDAGVRVPEPIAFKENVLVMEFIGSEGVPAPLLKDYPPQDPTSAYNTIIEYIKRLYLKAKLVHADLSEYNILNNDEELVIIDWGSAVELSHPSSHEFLLRDIRNISRFFERLNVEIEDPLIMYKTIIKSELK
ncbi:MAG: serine protein kinase RIO [Thermoprotei archaeon]|nr:MAG: serine protein kinase RIO [Thermoprotei archaeon]RLE98470.1 MAG: serine protein kinase RIO [Thermoprotei archaeon]